MKVTSHQSPVTSLQHPVHKRGHWLRVTGHSCGFTLIETLVALSVLALAVVGPLSLAATALSASQVSRDQLIAYYLAQEGIEIARNQRDDNRLAGKGGTIAWTDGWANLCGSSSGQCYAVVDGSFPSRRIENCNRNTLEDCLGDDKARLFYSASAGLYGRGQDGAVIDWEESGFLRALSISVDPTMPDEAKITAVLRWRVKGLGRNREVRLTEHLFNLQ